MHAAALAKEQSIAAEGIVLHGKPHEDIVETAIEKNIDLIVMGRHGRTGLKHLLLGSVTERVIGYSQTAVVVARGEWHPFGFRNFRTHTHTQARNRQIFWRIPMDWVTRHELRKFMPNDVVLCPNCL